MERITESILIIILLLLVAAGGCTFFRRKEVKPFVSEVLHPDWSKDIVMYEVNLRQYSDSGTLKEFEKHLPRLKALGIDVLWFMPTYPIGEVNRKGGLGSYYSVKNYMDVNPEFGTIADLKSVIDSAHNLGMHVLLDWVPNHTSWDNPLVTEHPEWYVRDSTGKFTPPLGTDWTDVIQLDWSQKGLQDYMIDALKFWVNLGADGFRVDHPHNTPVEFWERARSELEKIKPVLMLAEHEEAGTFVQKAFDMNYAWEMYHHMVDIAQRKDSASAIKKYFRKEWARYPNNVYRLRFLTNHDQNSWEGTIDSLMGNAQRAFATLVFTAQGVPLIYSGQEACLDRKLKFFLRDPIKWDTCELTGFYADLIKLKHDNKALWNGDFGGKMKKIRTNKEKKIFAFYREKDKNSVLVFLNLTRKPVRFSTATDGLEGEYTDFFAGQMVHIKKGAKQELGAWGYRVLVK
ncbi:MAG: alpha-amylase family glycosyl hydrolase [Bacteroidota bacterium]|nr:alpha-amylase family glycosyl hydrolase [Bacteroidota bacterium]